jgi:MoaA/NifB/PqqE/SkfB family radical SAM enzyme
MSKKSNYEKFYENAIGKIGNLPVDKSSFCPLPFVHVSTMPHGEVKLCCRAQPPKGGKNPNVKDEDFNLKDYWHSEYMNEIRDSLITGHKHEQCKNCWKMEDNDIVSLRMNRLTDLMETKSTKDAVTKYLTEREVDFKIPLIELKLSNVCNFKCRMCWPKDSSKWMSDWDKVKQFYNKNDREYVDEIIDSNDLHKSRVMNLYEKDEHFVNHLLELMGTVEEIEFAGGEPLMDPIHYRVLETIPHPENVTLKYSTNLSIMKLGKHHVIDLWKKFKSIKLTISIDGHKELNAKIRRGSDWELLKSNIKLVKENLNNIDVIKGTTCISGMNAKELGETAEAIVFELGIHWHTSRVQWPDFLHANVLRPEELQRGIDGLKRVFDSLNTPERRMVGRRFMFETHLNGAISWLQSAIDHNKHEEKYEAFCKFNHTITDIDK